MNEIFIYDDIGPDYWGLVSAKSIINQLAAFNGKPVTVRINSNGGDVVEGEAIYNALRRHSAGGGEVTTENDALAASIASYIFMAGDVRRVAENSMIMLHFAWTVAAGNSKALRATADVLDKFDDILIDTYSAATGQAGDDLRAMLGEETWLKSQEALDKGFATEIGQPLNVTASVAPGRFRNTPQHFITGQPSPAAKLRGQEAARKIEHVRQQLRLDRQRMGV